MGLSKQIADGIPHAFRKHADYSALWHLMLQRSEEPELLHQILKRIQCLHLWDA